MSPEERAAIEAHIARAAGGGAMGQQVPLLPSKEAIAQVLMAQQGHIQPGVPQGLEGTPGPDQAQLLHTQAARENTPIGLRERLGDALTYGLDAAQALGPLTGVTGSIPGTLRMGATLAREAPGAVARAYSGVAGRAQAADDAVDAARGAFGQAADDAAAWTGRRPAEGPRPIGGWQSQYDEAADLGERAARARAEVDQVKGAASPGGRSAVPEVDGRPAFTEAGEARALVAGNPYVQAIKGRQGFPTKAEQRAMLDEALATSRLPGQSNPLAPTQDELRRRIAELLAEHHAKTKKK